MPLPLILAGLAVAAGAGSIIAGNNQAKALEFERKRLGTKKPNSDVQDLVSLSKARLNAQSPGSALAQQGIYQQQANALSAVNRNALDSSQALSLIGSLQGRGNEALSGLAVQDQQFSDNALSRLQSALGLKAQDDEGVWQDRLRDYNLLAAIKGTKLQNQASGINTMVNGVGSGLASAYGMGMLGGNGSGVYGAGISGNW